MPEADHHRGHSQAQVARETGVGRSSLYRTFGANYFRGDHPQQSMMQDQLRDEVLDMPPREAVEYLLEIVDALRPELAVSIRNYYPTITPVGVRILECLLRQNGVVISRKRIYNFVYFDKHYNDLPDPRTLDVHIHQLRRAIAALGIPVLIGTIPKDGIRLARTSPDFKFPWEK